MLSICNLTRDFGGGSGVFDFSADCDKGEIVAVVGPNGAGKSTLFSLLARITNSDNGSWTLDGIQSEDIEARLLGYAADTPLLFPRLRALDCILFDATMRGIEVEESESTRKAALFGLSAHLGKRIKHLSLGSQRKVSLLCALQGSPRLIILDEPLNGLDIPSVVHLTEFLREKRDQGATILISSHLLAFLDGLADRIIFLREGCIAHIHDDPSVNAEDVFRELFMADA